MVRPCRQEIRQSGPNHLAGSLPRFPPRVAISRELCRVRTKIQLATGDWRRLLTALHYQLRGSYIYRHHWVRLLPCARLISSDLVLQPLHFLRPPYLDPPIRAQEVRRNSGAF